MVSPLRALNSVRVLRVSSAGPLAVLTDGSIELTSESMTARMMPSRPILGSTSSLMPYGLNITVTPCGEATE